MSFRFPYWRLILAASVMLHSSVLLGLFSLFYLFLVLILEIAILNSTNSREVRMRMRMANPNDPTGNNELGRRVHSYGEFRLVAFVGSMVLGTFQVLSRLRLGASICKWSCITWFARTPITLRLISSNSIGFLILYHFLITSRSC